MGDLGQVGPTWWGSGWDHQKTRRGIENHFVNIFTNFTNVQVTMWDGESRSNAWEEPCSHISGGEGRC